MNYALKYRRLWILYAVLATAVALTGVYGGVEALRAGESATREGIGVLISTLYLTPLYGYVFQRRIKPRWLWTTGLILAGTVVVAGLVIAIYAATVTGTLMPVLSILAGVAFLGPNLFAIHQYVYSRHIWNAT